MSGFTTSTTISELIGKKPIKKKKRSKRRYKTKNNRVLRATQTVLKI
tara:strand:+ start:387 stop:527 length:141 start_codon:yes stop_codon:yes gene_type:complete